MTASTLQEALRATLANLMAKDERIFVIGEDVGVLGGAFGITQGLLERFGAERVRDAPISETAILGAAIGAAMVGARPICEMQFVDFMLVALDQLLHQAAPMHFASGGTVTVPLVIRANYGLGGGAGPQDTGTLYGSLMQFPGLTVVIPTGPVEGESLLRQAVADPNPILFLEPRELYRATDGARELEPLPLRKSRVLRRGRHITCVAAGGMVRKALAAAEAVSKDGIEADVIDLRCVMPLDEATILESVARTGRLLALDEAPRGGGLAAEVLALAAEAQDRIGRPITARRLTSVAAPIAYAAHLARAAVPDVPAIAAAILALAASA